jgi:hypothetical protein
MRGHECYAVGCRRLIADDRVFCDPHAAMLQSDTRRLVERGYRPGGKQTKVFDQHLALARSEILSFQMTGHRVFRETEFEW